MRLASGPCALPRIAAGLCAALAALTWSAAPSHAQFFNAVYSRDANDVIAVADSGAVFRSVNGGITWTRASSEQVAARRGGVGLERRGGGRQRQGVAQRRPGRELGAGRG
jgi:hypothetical protein